jgi:hypothetical protein
MGKNVNGNPWLSMWLEPRATIRSIVNTNPSFRFVALSAIYGLPMALNLAQSFSMTNALPLWAILIAALVVCTFLGMIGISICSWLLLWTGRWIGGDAKFESIRAAVAWSNVPNIVTIAMWAVLVGFFGTQVFAKGFSETTFVGYQAGVVFLVFLIQSIVSIWGFVLLLHALGEVQGFSAWKALLNVIIPIVLIIAVLWVIGWALSGSSALIQ